MQAKYQNKFSELNCCVIVPTYNNHKTLAKVLDGILAYTNNIIVVNDGSTRETAEVLSSYNQLTIITLDENRGKGNALKIGFRIAVNAGYEYAITIDSDAQHMPSDLPKFLDKLEAEPDCLIIGARNMNQDGVPGKSSFGNRFSNFWYLVETGIKLPDTQSGYRLYPIHALRNLKYFTTKFEFEIEVIVRAAWKGIKVTSVPIEVFYARGEDRVTHFRPFRDFFRISVLNTVLVTLAFLIYRPLMYIKSFSIKKFLGTGESTIKLAFAVGFGGFMGVVPLWGFQMITAAFLAHFMRLNKALVLIASNISFGPMMAVFIYAGFLTGSIFVKNPISLAFDTALSPATVKTGALQFIIGSIILSIAVGCIMFIVSYAAISIRRRNKKTVVH